MKNSRNLFHQHIFDNPFHYCSVCGRSAESCKKSKENMGRGCNIYSRKGKKLIAQFEKDISEIINETKISHTL